MKINEARSLLNDTYIDWSRSRALANPHYIQKDSQITWETPRQFIEFIMALCYPKIYEKHRLDSGGRYTNEKYIMMINSNCVPLREHNVFRQMAHLRIPIISEGRGK